MSHQKKIIDSLNDILATEATTIHRYFLQTVVLRHLGFPTLAECVEKALAGEMRHAQAVMERILFLGGKPEPRVSTAARMPESILEMLENDRDQHRRHVKDLNLAITAAHRGRDQGTVCLLTRFVVEHEGHLAFDEAQIKLARKVGEKEYLNALIKLSPEALSPVTAAPGELAR
ncbi:MAG: ferritin-like domain-containing protein [Polyangiaceae bacterium]